MIRTTSFFALSALTLAFSIVTPACSASTDAADDTQGQSEDDLKKSKDFFSCHTDNDCVAAPKVGCCTNGWMVAVNKHQKTAYEHSFVCTEMIVCPMYVIHDTRVAECNGGTQNCEMILPADIRWGGRTIVAQ